MSPIVVLLNQNAHGIKTGDALARAMRGDPRCMVFETASVYELDEIIGRLARPAGGAPVPKNLVLAGGDGSFMAGVTAVAKHWQGPWPSFGFIAAGTVVTVARNLGIPRTSLPYGRKLVDALAKNSAQARAQATIRVRDAWGGKRIGFMWGTGLVARFFELYDAEAEPGIPAAMRLTARLFGSAVTGGALAKSVLGPAAMRLAIDDRDLEGERYSLVVSSVLPDLGLHMRPTFRAHEAERAGKLHLVASRRAAPMLAAQVPFVMTGRRMRGSGHVDALAQRARVTFEGDLRSYVLDGDRFDAGDWVEIEPGPSITLLFP